MFLYKITLKKWKISPFSPLQSNNSKLVFIFPPLPSPLSYNNRAFILYVYFISYKAQTHWTHVYIHNFVTLFLVVAGIWTPDLAYMMHCPYQLS